MIILRNLRCDVTINELYESGEILCAIRTFTIGFVL